MIVNQLPSLFLKIVYRKLNTIYRLWIAILFFLPFCTMSQSTASKSVAVIVLGTVQDGGSPHIGCEKECCAQLFETGDISRKVVSLGVVDFKNNKTILMEATPDLPSQIRALRNMAPFKQNDYPDGIFLTHAHIGHYSGLMYLGKEAANSQNVPVYTMPQMHQFLRENGPWDQLAKNKNIQLKPIENEKSVQISKQLTIVPFTVPHRDEYSETVGFKIIGPNKTLLFIPDIDKWEKWDKDIKEEIKTVDHVLIDATFFDSEEINNRDLSEIPHPFVIESMALFKGLSALERKKVHFIHFNHTNPLLRPKSLQTQKVLKKGFQIARQGMVFKL